VFNVTKDGSVCITFATNQYPGTMSLKIYNSAGEHIITLYDRYITQPLTPYTATWNGLNKYGQKVASGVYLIYLSKPYGQYLGRIVVIR
jgi:hypothetical protein